MKATEFFMMERGASDPSSVNVEMVRDLFESDESTPAAEIVYIEKNDTDDVEDIEKSFATMYVSRSKFDPYTLQLTLTEAEARVMFKNLSKMFAESA